MENNETITLTPEQIELINNVIGFIDAEMGNLHTMYLGDDGTVAVIEGGGDGYTQYSTLDKVAIVGNLVYVTFPEPDMEPEYTKIFTPLKIADRL